MVKGADHKHRAQGGQTQPVLRGHGARKQEKRITGLGSHWVRGHDIQGTWISSSQRTWGKGVT